MGVELRLIGVVESPLTELERAPKQADEGAPAATLRVEPEFAGCCDGLAAGDGIVVLTWFDRADRAATSVHPRGDQSRPATGVFATRSPSRPNPIGLHQVTVVAISEAGDGSRSIRVDALEAIDGTPVLDLKPVLEAEVGAR